MPGTDKSDRSISAVTDQEALDFHARGRPGKIELAPTKPLTTQRDLSLAYSPGVAAPCLRIAEDPSLAYDYTARGNMVAVISNGTAVLGLGNIGALASKPVMEGKAVLFKRFADVDSIDLEVSTEDVDEFVNCVRFLGPSFGGINLEDIKAPECFIIEQRLREEMDIPVFHDDQHGTAIIAAAGLINALHLTDRDIEKTKLVVQRRRRGGHRLHGTDQGHGHPRRQRDPVRFQGRHLPGSRNRAEPVEVRPRREDRRAHPRRRSGGRGCLLRPVGQGRGDPGHGPARWRIGRSCSPWRIRIPKSRPTTPRPCARTRSWRRAGPTTPIR
jgi:hypothetical protein